MKKLFLMLAFSLVLPSFLLAQVETGPTDEDVSVTMSPLIPGPNESVEVVLGSYSVNLSSANIEWRVNGALALFGTGKTTFSFTTGPVGTKTTVDVSIVFTADDLRIEKRLVVEPAALDLLWEAPETYVPPFYKGKALPASEAIIQVAAMPARKSETLASMKALTYRWKRNYNSQVPASGYGKQVYPYKHDYLSREETISVEAQNTDGSYKAAVSIGIPVFTPEVIFYQRSEDRGVDYRNSLEDGVSIGTDETAILAEPYYFSPKDKHADVMKYAWSVNGNTVVTPDYPSLIVVRGDGGRGFSSIAVSVENISKIFQKLSRVLRVAVGS